jgi:hypothetical protein
MTNHRPLTLGRIVGGVWSRGQGVLARVRGHYYRLKFRLTGQRVIIGRRFRVTGTLDIRGPGTVIFGDDCGVVSTRLSPTTPWTHAPDAVIRFGNRVLMTGTRLGCETRIEVSDFAGLADARIMDTDFHSLDYYEDHPRYNTYGRSKPITIGRNAWIGAGSMILKGVRIGDNAIVAAGAVVVTHVPANAVVLGNPARVVSRVRSLGKWADRNTPRQAAQPSAAAAAITPPIER